MNVIIRVLVLCAIVVVRPSLRLTTGSNKKLFSCTNKHGAEQIQRATHRTSVARPGEIARFTELVAAQKLPAVVACQARKGNSAQNRTRVSLRGFFFDHVADSNSPARSVAMSRTLRSLRAVAAPILLLTLVTSLTACGGYDTDKAKGMTCSEFAHLNSQSIATEPTSEQSDIIKALLQDRKLDDGAANVSIGYTNLMADCGIGVSGDTTNPDATLGSLAASWQGN